MPFEVFPVRQPDSNLDTESDVLRTAHTAANEIRDIYTKVAEAGGSIVAEHALTRGGDRAYGTGATHWLFLVAEIPEPAQAPCQQ